MTVHRTMYRSSTSLLLRPLYRIRPTHVITNQLIPITSCLNLSFSPINWNLSHHALLCFLFFGLFGFGFVCVFVSVFSLSGGFWCFGCFVSFCDLVMQCDSTQDYVAVLHQFTFKAIPPRAAYARLNFSINSKLQHAPKHVERPGGSHEGVGRKK